MGCFLRRPHPIFSMVTGTIHPRPIFSVLTGTSPDYLPLLFSYSVYIGCVVLQGCLRSHCGISRSQMVNLIPTCIVSSKKNYFRMILINSEKQCIGSCATPVVTPSKCPWGVLYDVRVLYLAWLLELALVICPFYFHRVYRLCSTTRMVFLRVHLKIFSCKKCFFLYFYS